MDCDDPEADSYNPLRKSVREIEGDEKMLRNFLRFVTGSDLLLSGTDKHYHRITVSMVAYMSSWQKLNDGVFPTDDARAR